MHTVNNFPLLKLKEEHTNPTLFPPLSSSSHSPRKHKNTTKQKGGILGDFKHDPSLSIHLLYTPKRNLILANDDHPGHYRLVNEHVWRKIVELYPESGPTIAVKGFPYNDVSRWQIFDSLDTFDETLLEESTTTPPSLLPPWEDGEEKEEEKGEEDKKDQGLLSL